MLPLEQEQKGIEGLNKCLFFSKTSGITCTGRQHKTNEVPFIASSKLQVALTQSGSTIVG